MLSDLLDSIQVPSEHSSGSTLLNFVPVLFLQRDKMELYLDKHSSGFNQPPQQSLEHQPLLQARQNH